MAHQFTPIEKAAALKEWALKVQERVQTILDSVNEVEVMERWSFPMENQERAFGSAYDSVHQLSGDMNGGRLCKYYTVFHVRPEHYDMALKVIKEKAEVMAHAGDPANRISVPPWAVYRATSALQAHSIKFKTEPGGN